MSRNIGGVLADGVSCGISLGGMLVEVVREGRCSALTENEDTFCDTVFVGAPMEAVSVICCSDVVDKSLAEDRELPCETVL